MRGIVPDWAALRGTATGRRIPLPPYPFERTRHWVPAPGAASRGDAVLPAAAPRRGRPKPRPASEQVIARAVARPSRLCRDRPGRRLPCDGRRFPPLAVQIVAELNRRFDADLRPHDLIEAPTARRLAQRLSAGRQRGEDRPFALCRSATARRQRAPLFLFHAVGGTVDFYQDLAAALDPGLPIHAFQSLALDSRTSPTPRWRRWPAATFRSSAACSPRAVSACRLRPSAARWPMKPPVNSPRPGNRSRCWR